MAAPLGEEAEAFSFRGSGPQGLRRPRFSFFRFTCQTSRSLTAPSLLFSRGLYYKVEPSKPVHPTWPRGWPDDSPYEQWGASRTRHRAKASASRPEALYRLRPVPLSTPVYESNYDLWISQDGPVTPTLQRTRLHGAPQQTSPRGAQGSIQALVWVGRRTAATFLRRSCTIRVGDCAMPGERH